MRLTCGHLTQEGRVQLDDGAQHLLALLRGDVALALAFEDHLVVLPLQEHQHVPEQHTLHLWEKTRAGGGTIERKQQGSEEETEEGDIRLYWIFILLPIHIGLHKSLLR